MSGSCGNGHAWEDVLRPQLARLYPPIRLPLYGFNLSLWR